VHVVGAGGRLPFVRLKPQVVPNVNAADDQDLAFQLDLARRLGRKPTFPGRYPARLQRAP
jgi:hypothetical protein